MARFRSTQEFLGLLKPMCLVWGDGRGYNSNISSAYRKHRPPVKNVLKTVIRIILAVTLVSAAALSGFVYTKGSQPMHPPEAQGLTYGQFMADRWQATQELPDECDARWTTIWLTHLPMTLMYGTLFTAKALYPEAHIRISQTNVTVPEGITWADAPDAFWAVAEQMAVITFVRVEGMECGLRGVQSGP